MNPIRFACVIVCCLTASTFAAGYDIRDQGAKGDGQTLVTAAIQKAIDAAASAGGGTVYFPAGKFVSGTLRLKSNVTLQLDAGCILLGSTDIKDYPDITAAVRSYTDNYVKQALIAGEDLDNVGITGRGTIDGQGAGFKSPPGKPYENRPYVIRLVNCRNVLVEGLELRSSPMWMQQYLACERLTIRGLRVFNHVNHNNDGLDIDGCSDVVVSDCIIDSDDDAICLKSTLDRPCQNVVISNCVAASHCNAIKMGTESNGGFVNIAINNCAVSSPRQSKVIYGQQRGLAGIALEIVDGGRMENIAISNICIKGVNVPLFLRLGNRARPVTKDGPVPAVGTMKNICLSNIVASGAGITGCAIAGLPDHPIEDVSLNNIRLSFEGGGSKELIARKLDERPAAYPESAMFGKLPAYGLYFRHVKGIKASGITLQTTSPDERQAIALDDVQDAEGLAEPRR